MSAEAQDLYDYADFFWMPNVIFETIGFDFLQTSKSRQRQLFRRLILTLLIGSHIYCSFYATRPLIFAAGSEKDLLGIVTLASYMAYSINSNVKFLTIFLNRKLAQHINQTLSDAYPRSIEANRQYNVNSFYWSKIERYGTVSYLMSCWSVIYGPVLVSFYLYMRDNVFPYLKWYHFEYDYEYRGRAWIYLCTCLVESCHSHYTIIVNWGTDLWLVAFTAQLCMHLAYVARNIEKYEPSIKNEKQNCKFLVQLMQKHQMILGLNEDLNQIFGISMVFHLLSTISVFCIVAVRLVAEENGLMRFTLGPFLITAVAQFFMVCYHGQRLMDLSENIATACYSQGWYKASNVYKKMLLLMLLRSQKQAQLTAKGLQPISLDTFRILMGFAYRAFALLQTLILSRL